MLLVAGGGVDEGFTAGLDAAAGVALLVDAVRETILVVGLPGDDPAAVAQGCDARSLLLVAGGGVDEGFTAGFGACRIEALLVDAVVGTILVFGLPRDEPAAVAQGCDARGFLTIGRGSIDKVFAAGFGAGVGVALLVDAVAGTILGIRLPRNQPAAVA